MQEFFFTKIAPVESITDVVLLDFLLMLLSGMFISSYTTNLLFRKEIVFLNVYISMKTVFECLYMFFG